MTLRKVLLTNAISSGITGILLVVTPCFFVNLFKVKNIVPFVEVGIFLILFSFFVLATALKSPIRKSWTNLIIGMDVTWVIVSVIAVPLLFSSISTIGTVIILAVALWVCLMAYLQRKKL